MTKVGLRALDKGLSDEGLNLDQFGSILSLFYYDPVYCCLNWPGMSFVFFSDNTHVGQVSCVFPPFLPKAPTLKNLRLS
jgi:hypothetical protein